MFEIGTNDHWWEMARKYPILSFHNAILKPLGYAHMINLIETFKPGRILEIGHGTGSYVFEIFHDKIEIWGLDDTIADNKVEKEKLESYKLDYPNVKFIRGILGSNLSDLPDNYFDMVYSVSVLEHIPHEELQGVFTDTFRVLKPGGIVSHSYDISFLSSTKEVFDSYERTGFEWLKPRDMMNVFWEDWLNKPDREDLIEILRKITFENPSIVAENFMWSIERKRRPSPGNYVTILSAARKPFKPSKEIAESTIVPESDNITSVTPGNFDHFTYSKKKHFDLFSSNGFDVQLYGMTADMDYLGINNYQDLLVYSFIQENIKPGSRILMLGNSTPVVFRNIKNEFDCWTLLNSEEDLQKISRHDLQNVTFRFGMFGDPNSNLPENYFDFVFCTTNLVYDNSGSKKFESFFNELNRILKDGSYALLTFVCLLKAQTIWNPEIIDELYESGNVRNKRISNLLMTIDKDLYHMSERFYNDSWKPSIKKSFKNFGRPFSYNVLYEKSV